LTTFEHDTIPAQQEPGRRLLGGASTDEWTIHVGDRTGEGIIRFTKVSRPGLDTAQEEIVVRFKVVSEDDFRTLIQT